MHKEPIISEPCSTYLVWQTQSISIITAQWGQC